jgi:steroid delta-isomerase-like uncharacterized protein
MTAAAKPTTANVIPTLRYRDAAAAIDWLCRAFGFEQQLVVPDGSGGIAHAQLAFGNGMIMLGSAHDGDAFGKLQQPPRDRAGVVTQSAYVIVADPRAHHDRAVAAGAEIVLPLEDKDYGGSGYSCRDPEGHVWSFGDYDPWAEGSLRAEREAVVRQHMEAENVHDFDAVIATFDHPRYELVATDTVHDGEAAVREYFRTTRAAFPDQRNELIALHHGDDAVIAEFWLLGTHRGPLGGLAPTGRSFRTRMTAIFAFEGAKIVCERVYFDTGSILRQLTV